MSEPFFGPHGDEDSNAFALTEAQMREVDRRLAAHDDDPIAAIPWEQVEAEARVRLSKVKSRLGGGSRGPKSGNG